MTLDKPKITPEKAFDDNYIWCLEHAQEDGFVAVDPGNAQAVIDFSSQIEKPITAILVTHHHHDHTGGIDALVQHFGPLPIYGPTQSPYTNITDPLLQSQQILVLGYAFEVLEIPGHTLDHIAYYNEQHGILFCGDTLFLAGCGRLFEGTPQQMFTSLAKIMALPAMTRAYPTHEYSLANLAFARVVEPNNEALALTETMCQQLRDEDQVTLPTRLVQEAAINPFVRTQEPAVVASAEQYAGKTLSSPWQVFAALRTWKNSF